MGRFADAGDPDTLRWLGARLTDVLASASVRTLDLSAATGPQRLLTQAIARELYLHARTEAIEYPSRHGETIRCIAVFETEGDLPDIAPNRALIIVGSDFATMVCCRGWVR